MKNKIKLAGNKLRFILPLLLICILFFLSYNSYSQQGSDYQSAKKRLLNLVHKKNYSDAYLKTIDRFYTTSCDSLIKTNMVIDGKTIAQVLVKYFLVCEENINQNAISTLRIPSLNYNFLSLLKVYKKEPIEKIFKEIGITQTVILQSAFAGMLLGDSIGTFAGMREMAINPYIILNRINFPRYMPYRDTLLYILANLAPDLLTTKLSQNDSFFTELVNRSGNMTVKAVSKLEKDKYFEEMLPFSLAISENRMQTEDIKNLLLTPKKYYNAFINEALRLYQSSEPETKHFLQRRIIDINKRLANNYFISNINILHESPDKMRYEVLNNLDARNLYFILIGGGGQLYTSSFLYVYKKFLKETEKEGLDKFFDDIDYYQFDNFISNVSGYGLVNDMAGRLKDEKFATFIGKYLSTLNNKQLSDDEIILSSMTMAEVLYQLRENKTINATLVEKIDSNLRHPQMQYFFMFKRMLDGFKAILLGNTNYSTDSTYDVLTAKRLQKKNMIVQACFFYDDEDATSSFNNYTALFDKANWEKENRDNYLVFNSKSGNKMKVYMNKPNTKEGCDSAQDEMLHAIARDGHEITSYIHRGHSYYLYKSLYKMTSSGQFVFLGSCGGYSEVLKLFQLNPDVNIIATRHIGSKLINDPLLSRINMDMVNNKDINWDSLWHEFDARFQSKNTKELFSSYIPPNKYIGIKFIRKIFNY